MKTRKLRWSSSRNGKTNAFRLVKSGGPSKFQVGIHSASSDPVGKKTTTTRGVMRQPINQCQLFFLGFFFFFFCFLSEWFPIPRLFANHKKGWGCTFYFYVGCLLLV